jgi:cytochrome c oxidase assembly protein subunit 15
VSELSTGNLPDRKIRVLAVAALLMAFVLVVAGGLVTSRDAGLAVPDWPLSYGGINPPRWYEIDKVRTEHGHRLIAASVAVVTCLLGLALYRNDTRKYARALGLAAIAAVLAQALMGGLRVIWLSLDLAMVHGWFGQAFFGILAAIVTVTSPSWVNDEALEDHTPLQRPGIILLSLIGIQLAIGVSLRHMPGSAGVLAHPLFYLHLLIGLSVLFASLRLARQASRTGGPAGRTTRRLCGLLWLQVGLGIATATLLQLSGQEGSAGLALSWLPTLHVAVGAGALGLAVAGLLYAYRPPLQRDEQLAADLN